MDYFKKYFHDTAPGYKNERKMKEKILRIQDFSDQGYDTDGRYF